MRRAVFILMDGARADVFKYLLARGDLPNIARYVVEPGGLHVATTIFPSTTMVAYLPFLYGRYPGPLNVPGIRWLDRAGAGGSWRERWNAARSYCGVQAGRLNGDINPAATGLFELMPESLAICSPITRGLRRGAHLAPLRRMLWGTAAHFLGCHERFDALVARTWIGAARRPWRFLFVVFPGIDGLEHLTGPWAPVVLTAYRRVDHALGEFVSALRRDGGSVPLLVVSSDHGFSPVRVHWDVAEVLEDCGIRTIRHPTHLWRRSAQAAVMTSGNACAHVYLAPWGARPTTPSPELLAHFAEQPAVALTAWRDAAGGVGVARGTQTARVAAEDGLILYQPLRGDPLGLGDNELRLADRAMLLASRSTPFPDAPAQLLQLFQSQRTGDVVLAANYGFDLRRGWEIPEHRSGHGSLLREHMGVPLAINLPCAHGPLRTVDVMPLIADHLGVAVPDDLDGTCPAVLNGREPWYQ